MVDTRSQYVHTPCGRHLYHVSDPREPPDPDRWGNQRYTLRCPVCETRHTVTIKKHGSAIYPPYVDPDPWLVPLP